MWILSFPNSQEGEPYECETLHEVREAVTEEIKKSVRNMGSDGYELVFPDGVDPEEADEQTVLDAHERGVEKATNAHFTNILARLNTTGSARLPDSVWIDLKEVGDDAN